jgi:hypothetical protein
MDWDERFQMNEDARREIAESMIPPMYMPPPGECQHCGSNNTFKTFDHKLVCRDCWAVDPH